MDISIFLAKLIGLYFLIIAFLWAFRQEQFQQSVKEALASRSLTFFFGFLKLFFGLIVVLLNSYWTYDFRLIITLLGYAAILFGIMMIVFPAIIQKAAAKITLYWYWFGILFPLIGGYLTYQGFFVGY